MTDSRGTASNWPASFAAGLHAALCRRLPPAIPASDLESLTRELTEALEQGQLTVPLNGEIQRLADASGWLDGDGARTAAAVYPHCPLMVVGSVCGGTVCAPTALSCSLVRCVMERSAARAHPWAVRAHR